MLALAGSIRGGRRVLGERNVYSENFALSEGFGRSGRLTVNRLVGDEGKGTPAATGRGHVPEMSPACGAPGNVYGRGS